MADGSIVIDTKINQKDVGKQLNGLKSGLKKGLGAAAKGASAALAGVAAAAGGVAIAIGAVVMGAKKFAAVTDRVDKLSQRIGISRTAFQEWDFILSQTGASAESLEMSVKTLSRAADEAAQGTKEYADTFDRLGVSVRDTNGQMKTQEELFNDVFGALSDLDNETERTAIASQLLGRSATQLAPAFNQGSEAIERMRQEAHDLGLIMSDDIIDSGVILTDNFDKLKRVGKGLFIEIFAGIVPALNKATTNLTDWIAGNGGVAAIVDKMRYFFLVAIDAIRKAWVIFIGSSKLLFTQYITRLKTSMSETKRDFTIAINSIKIAFLSLAQVIADKVLGSVADLLEVMGKLPFVGEKFNEASQSVRDFNENLSGSIDEARNASAAAIQAAKEETAAIEQEGFARVQAVRDETQAKLDAIDTQRAESERLRAEEKKAEREALLAEAEQNQIRRNNYELMQQLANLQGDYARAIQDANNKARDGFISQEEAQEASIEAARRYAEALYKLGVTAESAAEDGGDALRAMLGVIADSRSKVEGSDAGDMGAAIVTESFIDGLKERLPGIVGTVKNIMNTIGQVIQSGFSILSRAVDWALAFDPIKAIESMQELADNISEFFLNDLPIIPGVIQAGAEILDNLLTGLVENKEAIKTSIKNVIANLSKTLSTQGPALLSMGLEMAEAILTAFFDGFADSSTELRNTIKDFIKQMSTWIKKNAKEITNGVVSLVMFIVDVITDNLGEILSAGLAIIVALAQSLSDNSSEITSAVVQTLVAIVEVIAENLDTLIIAGIDIVVGIATGIAENLDIIVIALIGAIPKIIMALYAAQFKLYTAGFEIFVALVKGMVQALIEAPKALANAAYELFWGFIDYVKGLFGIHSPSTVFMGIGGDIIAGLIDGLLGAFDWLKGVVTNMVDWVADAFSGIGGFFGNLWDDITGGVGDALDTAGDFLSDAGEGIADFFGFKNGTNRAPGGLAMVGENGPELVNLPQGSKVYTTTETQRMLSGAAASAIPSMGYMGSMQSKIIKINEVLEIDGRVIGSVAFEYLDREAGVS